VAQKNSQKEVKDDIAAENFHWKEVERGDGFTDDSVVVYVDVAPAVRGPDDADAQETPV